MKATTSAVFFYCALFYATTGWGQDDKPGIVAAEEIEITALVKEVNYEERTVTLQGPRGGVVTINVPDEAQNLDKVHAGSKVRVRYLESMAVKVSASSEQPNAVEVETLQLAPKGANPAGAIVRVREVTGLVEDIDYDSRMVAVRGPVGDVNVFKVSDDVKRLNDVKPGDSVKVRYTEGLGLSMIPE